MTESSESAANAPGFTAPAALERGASVGVVSTELAARRTGMAFQRTRLSADRTLMSVIRTSLSLIGFGFTIFQFFERMNVKSLLPGNGGHAPRNFGLALVYLGVGMVVVGIVYHVQFMMGLRHLRKNLSDEGLIHAKSGFPISYTLIVAILLLFLGLTVAAGLTFRLGPFD